MTNSQEQLDLDLDLSIAGRVLDTCRTYRDEGSAATLWEVVAPELLGQPVAQILATELQGAEVGAWESVRRALALALQAPHGRDAAPVSRGFHEVVSVVGDVTAVVATARAVAAPIAALVRRALDRRRLAQQQEADIQIEMDAPAVVGPVALGRP